MVSGQSRIKLNSSILFLAQRGIIVIVPALFTSFDLPITL
jgi:hypothetical protein